MITPMDNISKDKPNTSKTHVASMPRNLYAVEETYWKNMNKNGLISYSIDYLVKKIKDFNEVN